MTTHVPLRSFLPPSYGFLPPLFDRRVPAERLATCASCAMCPATPEEAADPHRHWFHPAVKCCTYHPATAGFLLGAVLDDPTDDLAPGRELVRAAIRRGEGVTPWGLEPPAALARHQRTRSWLEFGQAGSPACPFFAGGRCTLWPYREATCATYFCKHVRGEAGRALWLAVCDYLQRAERVLAQHAARELLGLEPGPGEGAAKPGWGAFAGREEELYRQAHRLVLGVGPAAFQALAGEEQARLLRRLEGRLEQVLRPALPRLLVRRPGLRAVPLEDGRVLLATERVFAPLRVSARVVELLAAFDGRRTTAEVQAALLATARTRLPAGLLLELHQLGLLVEPAAPPAATGVDSPPLEWDDRSGPDEKGVPR